MKRQLILLASILFFSFSALAQSIRLSPNAEISVLTCGPSNLIHAIYGHTALRVNDPSKKFDIVFNYGVFSFSAPNFVYRFAKGQTDYMLAPEYYDDFYEDYKRNGRSIYEQVLNLSQEEKQQILDFLVVNAEPENREYRYNFFFDNCATRVRDVVEDQVNGKVIFPDNGENRTFRDHVEEYQMAIPWVNFGINMALGSPSDDIATAYEEMFLPDYLMNHFSKATIQTENGSRPLVKKTNELFIAPKASDSFSITTPFVILLVLCLLTIYISYNQYKSGNIKYLVDYLLLFLTGLIGVAALWFIFYSEHPPMHPNYNVWWAVPLNLPFLFLWMVKKMEKQTSMVLACIIGVALAIFLTQRICSSVIPYRVLPDLSDGFYTCLAS